MRDRQTFRQEMPMSMSRWVSPQERRAALPEEPLARVRMVVIGTFLPVTIVHGPSESGAETPEGRNKPSSKTPPFSRMAK